MTWRDVMCGDPRAEDVGRTLTLAGWAARRRDHGGLVFIDLRDRSGLMQLVVNPERAPVAAELAKEIRNEFVLRATGQVVARGPETVNRKMPTGEVELQVDELEIVSRSTKGQLATVSRAGSRSCAATVLPATPTTRVVRSKAS